MKPLLLFSFLVGCSTQSYKKTVDRVELNQFMGKWYVLAGRLTSFETGAHNAVETYTWNEGKKRIDIDFTYNKNSFTGPIKSIPQKGWVKNETTNSYWEVSPFWPLYFDYLIIDLAKDYSWTAIGVPNQKYLWIMARDWKNADKVVEEALKSLKEKGYNIDQVKIVPQKW
jgi:apolipoprotein D and lipocalin family protein